MRNLLKRLFRKKTIDEFENTLLGVCPYYWGMETHKWFKENSRIHAPMIISSILTKKLA